MDLEVGMRNLSWTLNLGFKVGIRVLRLGFGFQRGGGYVGSDLGFEVRKGIEFDMVSGPRRIR